MIEIKNVTFAHVFENLNLVFPDKGIAAIIAPSGNGKTTLLNLISGLLTPERGEIVITPQDAKISYVFQDQRLLPWYTVLKNISVVTDRSLDEIKTCLLKLGIGEDLWDKKPDELSGGECQRVCLARAFLFGGDILLLDEPFTGLDADNRQKAVLLIKEISKDKLVILVSHIAEDIELADEEIFLNNGAV